MKYDPLDRGLQYINPPSPKTFVYDEPFILWKFKNLFAYLLEITPFLQKLRKFNVASDNFSILPIPTILTCDRRLLTQYRRGEKTSATIVFCVFRYVIISNAEKDAMHLSRISLRSKTFLISNKIKREIILKKILSYFWVFSSSKALFKCKWKRYLKVLNYNHNFPIAFDEPLTLA